MTESQYVELCAACDRLLLASDSTVERVAIPWLHVIREHPIFQINYADLFQPEKALVGMRRRWLRVLRSMGGKLRQIVRALNAGAQSWFGPRELPGQVDLLFVSHLLNPSQAGASDFYFGQLPDELARQGHSVLVALINHSGKSGAVFAQKWSPGTVPRVIFSHTLGLWAEAVLNRNLKTESAKLKFLAGKEPPGLFQRVALRASLEACSPGAHSALRLSRQIAALVTRVKPKAIVLTHEGHAWERVMFAAARQAHPAVRCIGYQHAAVFRLQHAIRRTLASGYNPDHILTAGSLGKTRLEDAPGVREIPISVLGSNRGYAAVSKSHAAMLASPGSGQASAQGCLVIPEGIDSECHLLFEFSMGCAQASPALLFIWRLHPIVTFKSLVAQNPKLKDLPPNIILSHATLEDDTNRCKWALYRGTTAIIQAVGAGLRPIYLQLPGEMTIDPLYDLKKGREIIATVQDFQGIVERDSNRDPQSIHAEIQPAREYCELFYSTFDKQVLLSSADIG